MLSVDTAQDKTMNCSEKRKFDTEIYDQIIRFLREHERESKNTSSAYERDIRQFFLTKRKKDIEHLTKKDLEFTIDEFEDYQSFLIDKMQLSVSTSNRHITSISECIKHLHRRGLVKNIVFLEIKKPTSVANSYDGFTRGEIDLISDYVLTTGRRRTGKVKYMLIRFTYDTCMRLEECLKLKWTDFTKLEDGNVSVRTIAKGNKIRKRKISKQLYENLLEIKEKEDGKVFNIGTSTVARMMSDIRSFLKINPEQRRLVFHSIRKAGAQWIWERTRDLNQVRQMLGHESIQTTEIYINKNEDYGIMGALSSEKDVNRELFKKVSHSDLVEAIGLLGVDKQMFINIQLEELIK